MHTLLDLWGAQDAEYFLLATKEPWRDRFVTRDDFSSLATWVRCHRDDNVYFCPHGFWKPIKKERYACKSHLLWADLDPVDPHELTVEPTIAWRTSHRRYSAIWRCDGEPTRGLRRGFNASLGDVDAGWHLTKVLRLWGSINHKYPEAPIVRLLWDDGPRYRLRDLRRYAIADDGVGNEGPIDISGIDAEAVVKKYGVDPTLLDAARVGHRSSVYFKLEMLLKARGASCDEIAAAVYASRAWQSKHGPSSHAALAREVARVMSKR